MSRLLFCAVLVAMLANVGVCVWAIIMNDPRTFATSGCIAVVLGFQAVSEMERRKP